MSEQRNSNKELAPDEEPLANEQEATNDANYQPKLKRPYDKLITDLSEEDLKSPGVHKLILSKSNELEVEIFELKRQDSRYRKLEINHAALSTELFHLKNTKKTADNLYSACLGSGTCLVGLAFSIYSTSPIGGFTVGGLGIALSVIAMVVTLNGKPKTDGSGVPAR